MDALLHLLNSDGGDELQLHVGWPPVLVLQGQRHEIEGPRLTPETMEGLLHRVTTTRQRRELRDRGRVQFVYRFRRVTDFVVRARVENDSIGIDVH